MTTLQIRLTFEAIPAREVQTAVERDLRSILSQFAPDAEPEIRVGKGSWWISAAVEAATAIGPWLGLLAASWAVKRYLLDRWVGPTADKVFPSPQKQADHLHENETEMDASSIKPTATFGENELVSPLPDVAVETLANLMKYAEDDAVGLVGVSLAKVGFDGTGPVSDGATEDRDPVNQVVRLRHTNQGWVMDFIEAHPREDINSLM